MIDPLPVYPQKAKCHSVLEWTLQPCVMFLVCLACGRRMEIALWFTFEPLHLYIYIYVYRCDISTTAGFNGHLKKQKDDGDLYGKNLQTCPTWKGMAESASCIFLLATLELPSLTKSGTPSPFLLNNFFLE